MKFLIGYDIAGNRVRSRVAKYLEGKAYRIQYSVFLFEGTEREAQEIRAALLAVTETDARLAVRESGRQGRCGRRTRFALWHSCNANATH